MTLSVQTNRALVLRTCVAVLAVAGCAFLAPSGATAQGAPSGTATADALALGQSIYRAGVDASGRPLKAIGAAQTELTGTNVACATCHRRSGHGTSEGRLVVRPITGPALRQEQSLTVQSVRGKARLGVSPRPPYSEVLLARAVRSGIDATGKPLDSAMPRYKLSDAEMKSLAAYLYSLSAQSSPGVDDQEIHFATVIQPDVAPARRRAMLDVMRAFFGDKGGSARQEEQRRDAGNMRMARSFRKWVLHVWELGGPSETWDAQLEDYYAKQPVFAMIGGLGTGSWRPIHEFSERREIPSVFPLVELPVTSGLNNYNLYLSRGAVLDAEVLAKFLREQGESAKIVQVYRRDGAGAVAAEAFRKSLASGSPPEGQVLEERVLEGAANETFWRSVYAAAPTSLVLWLGAEDLSGALAADVAASTLYLSSGQLAPRLPPAELKGPSGVRLVYPSDLPPKRDARLLRDRLWLHNKGIPITDESVQINTLFTLAVVSDVVGHMMDSFSRDFFVERLEHVVGQTPMASIYPSVSLGPGQRFAAKGRSIVEIVDADRKQLKALSGWIVP